jgi:hypothetical protein
MRFHKLEEFFQWAEGWYASKDEVYRRYDVSSTLHRLRAAHKFYVGDVDMIPGSQFASADFPRFPFDHCAFEFLMFDADDNRWNVLAFCDSKPYRHSWDKPWGGRPIDADRTEIGVWAISSISPEWWCDVGHIWITRSSPGVHYYSYDKKDAYKEIQHSPSTLARQAIPSPTVRGDGYILKGNEGMLYATAFHLGAFLRALNCVNVKTQVIEAPAALNKKRAKSGKPPIYEYKVLVLRQSAARGGSLVGSHESPRIHLRRGHIKHRKTGDFWWQPCVVGDRKRGVVVKDYRADELVQAIPTGH